MESSVTQLLKKIFRWEVIGVLTSIVSLYFAYHTFLKDEGGQLSISYHSDKSDSNDIVSLSSRNADAVISKFPTLSNKSKFALNNFFLQYRISGSKVDITPDESYALSYNPDGSATLTYIERNLFAHTSLPSPIATMNVNEPDGTVAISIKATYDGASEPFNYSDRITYRIGGSLASSAKPDVRKQGENPRTEQSQQVERLEVSRIQNDVPTVDESDSSSGSSAVSTILVIIFILISFVSAISFMLTFDFISEHIKERKTFRREDYRRYVLNDFFGEYPLSAKNQKWAGVVWSLTLYGGGVLVAYSIGAIVLIYMFVSAIIPHG